MFNLITTSAQSSFTLNGFSGLTNESFTSLNAFEFNSANYSVIKDWGFSFTYGGETEPEFTSNLYQISAAKNFGKHFIGIRYSPGYQKEFLFKSTPVKGDSLIEPVSVESKYLYKELFGLGYSYKISNNISAGVNLRYFEENITVENVTIVYATQPYFDKTSVVDKSSFLKTDIGFVWKVNDVFAVNINSSNLLLLRSGFDEKENDEYKLRNKKSAIIGLNISPFQDLNLFAQYETGNGLFSSLSKLVSFSTNKIGLSFSAFHDKQQNPFIAGIIPSAIFISKYFDISLSWINYFSGRTSVSGFNEFKENGISNIINNQYSFDKVLLTTNFKLNTLVEQKVKFLDVTINQNIYPALAERYTDNPIATAKVLNLTNERLDIKPEVLINGINNNRIQSPVVTILPFDTIEVNFFTVIPDEYSKLNAELTYADFYLMTVNDDYDDQYQKALLVNGINAWDGNVHNLKYFINKDLDFSIKYTKSILAMNKQSLDTIPNALIEFQKAKLIFESFTKNLTYISDPRASAEYVQYPNQTLELKGGDCDDLSVCYSSLLESVGVETALVDFNNNKSVKHVNLMFNTKLRPDQAYLITKNDSKYFIRRNQDGNDEVWISIETTSLTDFDSAWTIASDKFQEDAINKLGLIKGEVEIIDIN
jgi:hypothetical protein